MDGFDVYKIYLAIKLHFTSESYDYFKHNGKTTARLATFTKRRDRYFFISCRGLIVITIALIILLLDSLMIVMFGLVMWLEKLVTIIMPDGKNE